MTLSQQPARWASWIVAVWASIVINQAALAANVTVELHMVVHATFVCAVMQAGLRAQKWR